MTYILWTFVKDGLLIRPKIPLSEANLFEIFSYDI